MTERAAPRIDQVKFELYATPNKHAVVPLRHAHEPTKGFEDYVDAIKARVARGDMWAWCDVVIIARYGDYSGMSSCVQQVSVSSGEDFVTTHPHFEQLRSEAYAQLVENMARDETTFVQEPIEPSSDLAH